MQIGPIVASLMKEHDLTLEGVAERVRAQGATNVRYQHIQQLLDHPNRRPRYLPELAAAFGMSVEEFLGGPDVTEARLLPRHTRMADARRRSLNNPFGVSQLPGLDATTLASATTLVRLACKGLDLSFDPESETDAQIILYAAAFLQRRGDQQVTGDNVVDFTRALKRAREVASNEEQLGAGSTG